MAAQKFLIVIGGATATGKTAMAIKVARYFQTEILSADSRQFYREMNIGTAKPSATERRAVPHHFIDSLSIFDPYSVGDFERDALQKLDRLFKKHDCAVLAGGSGLFIRALCEGLDDFPEVPDEVRQKVEQTYNEKGLFWLQQRLQELDPVYYREVDLQNPARLLRAVSVSEASGRPFSSFRKAEPLVRPFMPIYIQLVLEREVLYERINLRVDRMMEQGLLEEARNLFPYRHLNALQTVGYQELFEHLLGKHSLDRAVELIKQHTRRYAKRQGTWFRKRDHWQVFDPQDVQGVIAFVEEKMQAYRASE